MAYIRTFLVYFYAASVLVCCKPFLWYIQLIVKKDYHKGMRKLNRFASAFAKNILTLTGSTFEFKGQDLVPQETSVLFVGNHQSNFDIVALLAASPKPLGFITKEEIKKIPALSTWATGIGSKYIPREETKKTLEVVIETIKFLKTHNHGMLVFPEGTRSIDGKVGSFKPGSLKIATKSGAVLVPFAVQGTRNIMRKGSKILYPTHITVEFLAPYSPEQLKTMNTVELAKEIEETVRMKVSA